ncbi:D-2-hydroxyacid dehydrogenase [Streptosporangium amethystogenes]|uniref:D-2-hydroxyacid dehydrogenase n=1 Tax=Streptosporangium amethystogenes TaxID=2002 RepID=UPI0012FC1C77|nr:D-2-hydroxyacid dehydrogenase [Streptosporangium amethystogenes]
MRVGEITKVHCYGRFAIDALEASTSSLGDRQLVACRTESEFIAELDRIEAVLGIGMPVEDWSRAGRLRLIHLIGSGADSLLPARGLPTHVQVANARGISAPAMAEFALSMLLSLAKRLPGALASQHAREWKRHHPRLISGATLLVVGAGPVGRELARHARALGMHVIGIRKSGAPCPEFDEMHETARFAELAARADAIVMAVPATAQTHQMLNADILDRCTPNCLIINVSRGDVIDEEALSARLHAGVLGGAALDVFQREPLPATSPLWDAPNTIITPHVSWSTPDYRSRVVDLFFTNIERVESGQPVINPVDHALGY